MKKILIVCDVFPPAFAPRMGYLVKYLGDFGWDADILCEDNVKDDNFGSLLGKNPVYRVKLDKNEVPTGFIAKLWRLFNSKRKFINNKYPYITAANDKLNKNDYSLILVSTAWNLFVLYAGVEIARQWGKPLVADFRDIHEQRPKEKLGSNGLKKVLVEIINNNFLTDVLKMRNKALLRTTAVITVTPWHKEQLLKYTPNVHLIFNGYDPDTYIPNVKTNQSKFKITYTGSVNSIELRDPTLLFKAINLLYRNGIIVPEFFRIQFYVPDRDKKLISNSPGYDTVISFIDFFNYVETSEIPRILNNSCLVLLLTNLTHNKGPKGVISTTRFFEYLGVERPILCVRSDESLMEKGIQEANAGVSARTVDEAYNFILEKWNEWKEKGYTTVSVNQEYKKQFSRKLQAKQFVDIFEEVVDSQDNIQ